MSKNFSQTGRKLLAFILAAIISVSTMAANLVPVHAADGTLNFQLGKTIPYGSYYTTQMIVDGNNTAFCVQPMKKTPPAGTYSYNLLGTDSPLRKALYYLPGGYGYEKKIHNQYLSGWSEDNCYVIGHLVTAYVYANYDADSGAFYGAPQNFIDKAVEIANVIKGLPNPPQSFRAFIIPSDNNQTVAGSWYQVPKGFIELQKSSTNPDLTNNNPNYSLKGAKYGIFNGSKQVETLVTNDKGYAKSGELEVLDSGSYTVRELSPSPGFAIDTKSYKVDVKAEETATVSVKEVPQSNPMELLLQKLDAETKEASPQGGASLKGAEFTVKYYSSLSEKDPAASGEVPVRTWIFASNEEGIVQFSQAFQTGGDALYYQVDNKTPCIPIGTVTIQETKAPVGYLPDEAVYVQKITGSGDKESITVYQSFDVPEAIIRGGVKIQKRDLETSADKPQGSATLEGAEFTITTLNEHPVLVNGKSYTKDQVVLTLKTDKSGLASTEKDSLPYGHYRVDETKAPEGYLPEGTLSVEFDITKQGEIVDLTATDSAILNQIKRGDLEFIKVSDGSLNRLANVPFSITSKTTGESHVLVTDKNGYASTASSWNKHTTNTNRGETSEDGIWFGTSKPNDDKGALLYDDYVIEELRCEANQGMNLLKFDVSIYKDAVTIDLGTLTNDKVEIATTALDKDSESHFAQAKEKVTLIDTVEYEGLIKGKEYKLVGTLMNQETGDPILIDEKQVTAETTFTAKKTTGSVEVTFTFDATSLKGQTIVVFEELYQEDLKLAVHADLTDADQTIYFPEIGTKAKDSDTNDQIAQADKEVTLIDTVSYHNLIPNKEYTLSGILMDQETKKPLLVDKKKVTAKTVFTPKESDGTVDVVFTFDGSKLDGKTTVVFESLSYEGKKIAVHTDIEDAGQTIFFPELHTQAKNPDTDSQQAYAGKEVTVIDTVKFKNLIPNKEYVLTGTLMDKENKQPFLVDEKPLTATLTFTPKESSGSVELPFTFDGSTLKGQTLVIFESLTYQEKEVAVHADLEDTKQSIYFPSIKTQAKDGADGDQEIQADEKIIIVDTVDYQNLIPGLTYKVSGILMDKDSKQEVLIDGKPVIAESSFTPDNSSGSVDVTFTFNAKDLADHTLVVFEKLFLVSGETEVLVTEHEDLEDKGQTVHLFKEEVPPADTPEISPPVKTGDDTPFMRYVVIGAGSLAALIALLLYLRKKKHSSDTK